MSHCGCCATARETAAGFLTERKLNRRHKPHGSPAIWKSRTTICFPSSCTQEAAPPVGYIALYGREPGTNCYEIGRLLADSPRMPRRGMGNEIVRLATALAFSQLDADTLVANVMHNNERSLRRFRCNGFTADPALSDSETVTLILHKQEFHYF